MPTLPLRPRPARRHALGAALGSLALAACGGSGGDDAIASGNALLAGLSLSASGLSPTFSPATTAYTLAVANTTGSLTVTPTAADSGATVRVNGSVVASGGTSGTIALAVGGSTLSIVVTAADGSSTRTYTVVVTRAAAGASTDATLAALALSAGTLSPAFAAGTLAYTASVAHAVDTLSVTATSADAGASLRVNGNAVASGTASAALSLAVGTNTVTVNVTAADGVTARSYTVTVTRAAATVSSDASLASLVLSAGTLSPAFSSAVAAYGASVANAVASITVTPTASSAAATVRVNGVAVVNGGVSGNLALAVGANTVTIVVTAEDGSSTGTTTLTVTRAAASVSGDATLSALALSSGSLSPAFAAATTAYTVTVANTLASITVTPTAASSGASVRVNGNVVASGSASAAIALAAGSTTTLSIVVTAEDGSTSRTYSIVVTRPAAGSCTVTPTETQGPYPLLTILSNSAVVRRDIREGKTGVPLSITLRLLDAGSGCAPVGGAAVYIWHCDKDGLYSGYNASNNAGQAGLTYLRGVQVTDANGDVSFQTVYPGWYAGRITHVHVQVYLNNNLAVTATATTQLAFPQSVTQAVYNSALYTKGQNTSVTSFAADNVFSDGTSLEMVAITGDTTNGYAASLTVTIA